MTDPQVVRQLNNLMRRVDEIPYPEKSPDLVSPFLALPMLRGLWVASVDSNGDWFDLSGLSKTLTYNGNPTFNYSGLVPYWDLDGTGDYFNRADEADLDIIGTETYVAAAVQGLTIGGWFYITTANAEHLIGKWRTSTNDKSYRIVNSSGTLQGLISTDGTTNFPANGAAATTSKWWYLAMQFDPSTTLDLWCDGTKYTVAAAVPASIFSGAAPFRVGADGDAGQLFTGRAALCFLCAAACSDAQVSSVFQQTRGAFGV